MESLVAEQDEGEGRAGAQSKQRNSRKGSPLRSDVHIIVSAAVSDEHG